MDKKNRILGITGMPGAGKSTASKILSELGAVVIDADKLAHAALKKDEIKNKISLAFGTQIYDNGDINKAKLAEIVFTDPARRKQLEEIIHPEVISAINRRINEVSDNSLIVLDVPLLHESGLDKICDSVLLITADLEIRLKRVESRGWSQQELTNRDNAIRARIQTDNCISISNNASTNQLRDKLKRIIS